MRRSLKSNLKLLCRVDIHVCGALYIAAPFRPAQTLADKSDGSATVVSSSSERGGLSTEAAFEWWTSVVQHAAAEHRAKLAQWELKRQNQQQHQQQKKAPASGSAPISTPAPPPPTAADPFAAAVSLAATGGDAARAGSGMIEGVAFALGMQLPTSARLHRHLCEGLCSLFGSVSGAAAAAALELVGSEAHVLGAFGGATPSVNAKSVGQQPPLSQPAASRALSVFVTLQRRFLPMLRAVCASTVGVDGVPVRLSVGVRPVEARRPSDNANAASGLPPQQPLHAGGLAKQQGAPRPSARRARIRRKAVRRLQSRRVAGGKRGALRR